MVLTIRHHREVEAVAYQQLVAVPTRLVKVVFHSVLAVEAKWNSTREAAIPSDAGRLRLTRVKKNLFKCLLVRLDSIGTAGFVLK